MLLCRHCIRIYICICICIVLYRIVHSELFTEKHWMWGRVFILYFWRTVYNTRISRADHTLSLYVEEARYLSRCLTMRERDIYCILRLHDVLSSKPRAFCIPELAYFNKHQSLRDTQSQSWGFGSGELRGAKLDLVLGSLRATVVITNPEVCR